MMRPPPFRVRTMLIAVAVLAGLLGLGLEALRLKRLADKYRYIAWAIGNDVQMHHANLARLEADHRKLLGAGGVDRQALPEPVRLRLHELDIAMESRQAALAACANLVLAYEHAAGHPWETIPEFVPHHSVGSATLKGVPVIRRVLARASPPPPPPAEFAQPTPPEGAPPPPPPPPTIRP